MSREHADGGKCPNDLNKKMASNLPRRLTRANRDLHAGVLTPIVTDTWRARRFGSICVSVETLLFAILAMDATNDT